MNCYRKASLIGGLALALGVSLASPAQAGLFKITPDSEKKMGGEAAREIEAQTRIVTGPVADWVNRVGQRLVAVSNPEFQYSFRVIDRPEINAFALPGGYVYVFTGLRKVAQTDDELAAVLAHEITHAEQHHYAKQYAKASKRGAVLGIFSAVVGLPNLAQNVLSIADFSMTQKYSRSSESEADHLGMQRMVRAGFNPQGMISLLDKLDKEDGNTSKLDRWFGDHPEGHRRVEAARQELTEVQTLQSQNSPLVKSAFGSWQSSSLMVAPAVTTPAPNQPAATTTPAATPSSERTTAPATP